MSTRSLYLGIDESNHGTLPEIYVAVASTAKKDARKEEKLPKHRKLPSGTTIDMLLSRRTYKHVVFFDEHSRRFGLHGMKIIAICEFLRHFNPTHVYMDGHLHDHDLEEISRVLYPHPLPRLLGIPRADKQIPVVNLADIIAYKLKNHYVKEQYDPQIYLEHRITPKMEEYTLLREP